MIMCRFDDYVSSRLMVIASRFCSSIRSRFDSDRMKILDSIYSCFLDKLKDTPILCGLGVLNLRMVSCFVEACPANLRIGNPIG